jgi:hypothetical protein
MTLKITTPDGDVELVELEEVFRTQYHREFKSDGPPRAVHVTVPTRFTHLEGEELRLAVEFAVNDARNWTPGRSKEIVATVTEEHVEKARARIKEQAQIEER